MQFEYIDLFAELIRKPFQHPELVWGIVPLYFSWAFAELTGEKPNFKTAIQTGFNLLWAGAQWTLALHPSTWGSGGRLMSKRSGSGKAASWRFARPMSTAASLPASTV